MELLEYMVLGIYAGFIILIPLFAFDIINLDDLVCYWALYAVSIIFVFFAIHLWHYQKKEKSKEMKLIETLMDAVPLIVMTGVASSIIRNLGIKNKKTRRKK